MLSQVKRTFPLRLSALASRRVRALALAACASLALIFASFYAPSRAEADSITYDLTTANTSSIGSGPFATLTVTLLSSTEAAITLTPDSGYTSFGQGVLALQTNGTVSATNLPSSITGVGSGNVSAFGSFNLVLKNFDGPSHGFTSTSPLTFDLDLTSGSWSSAASVLTANNDGYVAASHVLLNGTDATGYAAASVPAVPEPSSMVLFAIGLLTIALFALRTDGIRSTSTKLAA